MDAFEQIGSRWPGIEERVIDRLTADESLFDTKAHALRDGISKEEARAVLLLCSKTARECGLRLALSKDEQDLMARKFDLGAR